VFFVLVIKQFDAQNVYHNLSRLCKQNFDIHFGGYMKWPELLDDLSQ